MKKLTALLLAAVLLALTLAGCSGSSGASVQATAFSTGDALTLSVSTELNSGDFVSYGGYQFETTKTIDAMADLITKNNSGVTGERTENAYGVCYVFTKDAGGTQDVWVLYEKDPANMKNWYILTGAHRKVNLGNEDLDILLPLQLVSDSYLRDALGDRIELDTAYACNLKDASDTLETLFRSFYETSGLYRVDSLDGGGFSIAALQGDQTPLNFTFEESDTGAFFTVSMQQTQTAAPAEATGTVSWTGSSSTEPAALSGADALTLKNIFSAVSYGTDGAAEDYPYTFTLDGESYDAALTWADNAWSCSARQGDQTAAFTKEQAAAVAAVLGADKLTAASGGQADWSGTMDATVTAGAALMQTTASVNVRSMPSKDGDVLATLPSGTPVAVTGTTSNGWCEVLFGEKFAYMSADYLKSAS